MCSIQRICKGDKLTVLTNTDTFIRKELDKDYSNVRKQTEREERVMMKDGKQTVRTCIRKRI